MGFKLRKGSVTVTIDTFSDSVHLICTRAQLDYVVKHNPFSFEEKAVFVDCWLNAEGAYTEALDRRFIIWRDRKISILVHEVSHAVNAIMTDRGIVDDETRSYLCEYITAKILEGTRGAKLG